mmetsp:Transcript_37397/g.51662  ORF Transcript_37397/g.51662 Transcript_37397/m.51662 type:complete len:315 (-) Transcript_37397:156-1100(-)
MCFGRAQHIRRIRRSFEPVMVKPAKREIEKEIVPESVASSFDVAVKQRVFEKAKEMLCLLEMIQDHYIEFFQSPKFLFSAFRRFECWIDLLNSHQDSGAEILFPPFDVAYIWHAYMIRIEVYLQDVEKICPGTAKWAKKICWKWSASDEVTSHSKEVWESFTKGKLDSSFDSYSLPDSLDVIPEQEKPILPHHLKLEFLLTDLKWLPRLRAEWPVFTDPSTRCQFLSDSLEKYFKWLGNAHKEEEERVKKQKQNEKEEEEEEGGKKGGSFDGPSIELDVFWHGHLLGPQDYENDVGKFFKNIIWHRPKADGVFD